MRTSIHLLVALQAAAIAVKLLAAYADVLEAASVLAAQNFKPLSIELRVEVESAREKLLARIRSTHPSERRRGGAIKKDLSGAADALKRLISRQHQAAISDSLKFSGSPLQSPPFDLERAIQSPYEPKIKPENGALLC